MEMSAYFSDDRIYRYRLIRRWEDGPALNVIGLNPSTADESQDDATIRRCIGFAKAWGYHALIMTNLYALRSTDPSALRGLIDPVGPMNNTWLRQEALASGMVLVAWGAFTMTGDRVDRVMRTALDGVVLHCLGRTLSGAPRHPLYIRSDVLPMPYDPTVTRI